MRGSCVGRTQLGKAWTRPQPHALGQSRRAESARRPRCIMYKMHRGVYCGGCVQGPVGCGKSGTPTRAGISIHGSVPDPRLAGIGPAKRPGVLSDTLCPMSTTMLRGYKAAFRAFPLRKLSRNYATVLPPHFVVPMPQLSPTMVSTNHGIERLTKRFRSEVVSKGGLSSLVRKSSLAMFYLRSVRRS